MNGFSLIDKDVDWTSRDVCNKIQHLLHIKKVGHTGTLDPFATGLLLVSVGNGTKAGTFLEDFDKEYVATLKLGIKTSTGDLTGEIVETKQVPDFTKGEIQSAFLSLTGEIEQIPPMTSAIHFQGQKLYKLAHEGIVVERTPRKVNIKKIELIDIKGDIITFKCLVSKGTYIRVLGEDIADKLGTVGHLTSLRRTATGPYKVEDAIKLDEVMTKPCQSIYSILSKHMPFFIIGDESIKRVSDGASLKVSGISENYDKILVANKDYIALAVYKRLKDDIFVCVRGLL